MLSRNNSFDLIRHIAALMVLVSHHFALSGHAEPSLPGINSLGGFAVLAFFAISGYLVTQSFQRSSLRGYAIKRAARIFPALIACAFLMVYIVSGIYNGELQSNAGSKESLLKFLQISAFGPASFHEVTENFIFPDSLNGSLWTLKLEFGCYALVALALSLTRRPFMPLLVLVGFCALNLMSAPLSHPWASKISTYTSVCIGFFVGSTLALRLDLLNSLKSRAALAGLGVSLFAAALAGILPLLTSSIGFSLVILSLGTMFTDKIICGRFDISYGLYLYAFPVQQLLINCTEMGFYQSMATAGFITTLLAALSWLLIEKPALEGAKGVRRERATEVDA